MKRIILISLIAFFTTAINAQTRFIQVSASEPDAKIIVDGQNLGTGNLRVKVRFNTCVNVKIEKPGFLTYTQTYCSKKGGTPPPKKQFFEMKEDDALAASIETDKANIDFSILVKDLTQSEAWKLATQIVTDYFDAIEISDKETSYLRTAWSVKSFEQNTIRTRLIIKLGKSDPYTIKVKLVSEYSGTHGTSVKADEKYKEWDRVLRAYKNVIDDFTSRLGDK